MKRAHLYRKIAALSFAVSTVVVAPTIAPSAQADNPPRKILSGWIPYYSIKTSLPAAINNADLIREVMPFWYTLKFDGKNQSVSSFARAFHLAIKNQNLTESDAVDLFQMWLIGDASDWLTLKVNDASTTT